MGKVARSAERDKAKNSRMPRVIPPQFRLRSAAPPFHGGAFWCSTNSAYSAVPLRGAIVSMGLRGVQGGLRGEIEIFPGPPCKKGYKETPFSFVYLNPSVTAYAVPAPRRGEPFGALYNSNIATAGRQ